MLPCSSGTGTWVSAKSSKMNQLLVARLVVKRIELSLLKISGAWRLHIPLIWSWKWVRSSEAIFFQWLLSGPVILPISQLVAFSHPSHLPHDLQLFKNFFPCTYKSMNTPIFKKHGLQLVGDKIMMDLGTWKCMHFKIIQNSPAYDASETQIYGLFLLLETIQPIRVRYESVLIKYPATCLCPYSMLDDDLPISIGSQ